MNQKDLEGRRATESDSRTAEMLRHVMESMEARGSSSQPDMGINV